MPKYKEYIETAKYCSNMFFRKILIYRNIQTIWKSRLCGKLGKKNNNTLNF